MTDPALVDRLRRALERVPCAACGKAPLDHSGPCSFYPDYQALAEQVAPLVEAADKLLGVNIVNIFDSSQRSLYPDWLAVARTHADALREALAPWRTEETR